MTTQVQEIYHSCGIWLVPPTAHSATDFASAGLDFHSFSLTCLGAAYFSPSGYFYKLRIHKICSLIFPHHCFWEWEQGSVLPPHQPIKSFRVFVFFSHHSEVQHKAVFPCLLAVYGQHSLGEDFFVIFFFLIGSKGSVEQSHPAIFTLKS